MLEVKKRKKVKEVINGDRNEKWGMVN